jgi:aminopeptidase YwaD
MKKNCIVAAIALFSLLGSSTVSFADKKADKKTMKRLKTDISYLASDELEGRRTSTAGEAKATDYIESRYKEMGISPYKGHYRYPFHFIYGKEIAKSSKIRIGNSDVKIKDKAFPLPFSGNGSAKGEVEVNGTKQGSIRLISLYGTADDASSPHFEWEKVMNDKAKEAEKQGATAVIFYDNFDSKYAPAFNSHSEFDPIGIPVVFIKNEAFKKYLGKGAATADLNITINKSERTGTNLAAYIDNKARYTVVLGAHYDHLGYGEDGNSLHANASKDHLIHHGADDNASGTAALLEEARWIKSNESLKHFNYLFVNFSGEELGLYGSKAFVKEQKIDSVDFAYMINMDMVGRLNDSTRALTLGGVGTSPSWTPVVKMAGPDFKLVIDSSGVGPSDHTSFYNAGIPVLFFFTGQHKDYHKPTDVATAINYDGEVLVLNYIDDVLTKMDADNIKPGYIVTKASSVGKVAFKVTLGIMPDYSFQEGGVRVDGVSEGRPAANAGINTGDIIIRLGDHKIAGMQSYMEALSKFKPGDKTAVVIMRNNKEMTLPIELSAK